MMKPTLSCVLSLFALGGVLPVVAESASVACFPTSSYNSCAHERCPNGDLLIRWM